MLTSDLNDYDLYLFHQGTHCRAYQIFGAHFSMRDGNNGVRFALWAPHADSVSIVGDFNNWDTRVNRMTRLDDGECWELFIDGLKQGDTYKYAILFDVGGIFMAYTFEAATSAKYQARIADTADYLSFVGCSSQSSITPAFAATQLNKLMAIVGETVTADAMKRTITEVAYDDE